MFCQIHRDLYGDAMMAVLPDGTNMADENQQKLFCYRVLLQKRELFLEELININVILFLIHELFRLQNSPKYVTL